MLKSQPQFVLTYWGIRGTTQAIRDLLEYLGLNYQDKVLEWPKQEPYNLEKMIDNSKLPNLKHKDFEVTEIVPIAKYLCRVADRLDLLGTCLKDEVTIDSFIIKLFWARNVYLEAMTSCEFKSDPDNFQNQLSKRLDSLKQSFVQGVIQRLAIKGWYMGYLTLADFFLYEILFYFQGFHPALVDSEVIQQYMSKFQELAPIKMYISSGRCNHNVSLVEEVNKKWRGARKFR